MKVLSDTELVHRARTGDTEAFAELFQRHLQGVRIEASRILFSSDMEDDVAQEAFLRALQRIDSLTPPFSFGSWVRQIARNLARNINARSPRHLPLEIEETHRTRHTDPSADQAEEVTERAIRALALLSPKLRETTRLSYLSNRGNRDIARRLGIPLGTVKRRLWESRKRMRKGVLEMTGSKETDPGHGIVPEIVMNDLEDDAMTVRVKGPGLYFGTVLEPGHAETCHFYDYPGGILTQTVRSRVIRWVDILGRKCLEVLIEHSECEPGEPNLLDYFEPREDGFYWVMRTVASDSYPRTRFMKTDSERFPAEYSCGVFEDYEARAVELTVGTVNHGKCLAVFWSWENGTPAESFFTQEGRQVLHRRYVGPEAEAPGSADYPELADGPCRIFRGLEYRGWYDTVLCQ